MNIERYLRTLTDGRNVDLNTPYGADAYLTQPNCPPFSKTLKAVKKMAKKKINGEVKKQLYENINMFGALFANASESIVEQTAYEELAAWISFIQWVLEIRTKYNRAGTWRDEDFDERIFVNIGCTFRYYTFVEIIYEQKLLHTMAEFMSAQPRLPCDGIAESYCSSFTNLIACLQNHHEDSWDVEKIQKLFMKMESCGALVHYLKCSTCPPTWDHNMVNMSRVNILKSLQQCTDLLRKRFCIGTPCGDMLEKILQGKEGYPRNKHAQIQSTLRNIYEIATSISDGIGKRNEVKDICRYCNKTGDDFKRCGRCKTAFYCSRECQTKDWKVHKKSCTPMDKSMSKAKKTGNALVLSFLQKHARDVVSAMRTKMEETGLERKDLVLELNFQVEDGNIGALPPSLQDPPFFKIGITKRYYEGDRLEEPSFLACDKGTAHYEKNIDGFLANIRGMHDKMTNGHFLICVMYQTNPSVLKMDYNSLVRMAMEGKVYFAIVSLIIVIIAIGIKKLIH